MLKKRFFGIAAIAAAMALVFVSCTDKKDPSKKNASSVADTSVAASFKLFGVDLEQVKPNVATPDDATNQRYSNAASSVYTMRAYFREKADSISNDVYLAYKERVFNYIKSISADNKCYRLRLGMSEEPKEVSTFKELRNSTGAYDDWSYKFNGMWLNVVTLYLINDHIGIDLGGMGTY